MVQLISAIADWVRSAAAHLASSDLPSVLFGWVLGIAGTLGVERYSEWKRHRRFIAGLRIELARLQGGMAVLFWNLTDREGAIGREQIEWVLSRTERATDDEGVTRFRTNFAKARSLSDAEIAALNTVGQKRRQQAVSLRTYALPFLETHLAELAHIADSQTVANVLNVKAQLAMFNEVVQETRTFHLMTFDSSLDKENHAKVLTLVEGGYAALRNRAKWIADSLESSLASGPLGV